ncbi:MAG: 30S ribosomal protein S21 [Candidatus Margulisiibacteriota bacterium]|jgi:small subunit ribosomal protein S21
MVEQQRQPGESIDSLLRKFKRKVKNEGTLQELRRREYFEKPSDEKKRQAKAAKRRTHIQQRANELL